jgi:hypothetical protein
MKSKFKAKLAFPRFTKDGNTIYSTGFGYDNQIRFWVAAPPGHFGGKPRAAVGLSDGRATLKTNTKRTWLLINFGLFLAMSPVGRAQPTITQQPASQSVSLGANLAFQVTASPGPLSFQWRFNELDLLSATNGTLTITNAQLTNAGAYEAVVTNISGSITSRVAHLEVDPTFTKITTGSIVTDVGYGIGCAWGDYDNDGFIDLIVTDISESAPTAQKNVLFHNNRDGTFAKITNTIVTAEGRDWRGCSWADYDDDGNLDLFVTSTDVAGFPAQNELFRNNGDGTFTKMTRSNAGDIVSVAAGGSEGCVWADYDNDGFLDMFVARYGFDWLYHNNGDGTYTAITNILEGFASTDGYFAAWGDYNNDGRPDLFATVKSDPPTNRLYLNLAGGSFARVTSGSIATDSAHSFGCAWGDYDNDGFLDLFVCNGGYIDNETNTLYHNNGDGTFTKMTSTIVGSIASDAGEFMSCTWGDYDNDGFLDLFVTTYDGGNLTVNYLYHNNGDGTFTRILSGSLVNDQGDAVGCAWGDYDNDGFLDLFVPRGANLAESNLLYRNNGNSNTWLKVNLVGTLSNRSAIGAKVRVRATIHGKPMWQMREINTGSGFGHSPLLAHFGLGDATNAETVRIEWPSGVVQTLTNVATRQALTVVEHQAGATNSPAFTGVSGATDGAVNLSAFGDTGWLYLFEGSTNLVNWTRLGVRSNATGAIQFTDLRATNYPSRFYRVSIP